MRSCRNANFGSPADDVALVSAQQTYQQAVPSLAQAKVARYADTAALFQSLGGGGTGAMSSRKSRCRSPMS
jgi:outer membrane protein TolC